MNFKKLNLYKHTSCIIFICSLRYYIPAIVLQWKIIDHKDKRGEMIHE